MHDSSIQKFLFTKKAEYKPTAKEAGRVQQTKGRKGRQGLDPFPSTYVVVTSDSVTYLG
jgi:hypothetical protein